MFCEAINIRKIEGEIKNEQPRDMGNVEHKTLDKDKQNWAPHEPQQKTQGYSRCSCREACQICLVWLLETEDGG